MYGHMATGCYNRETPTLVKDVNFVGAYGGQKFLAKKQPFLYYLYNEALRSHSNLSWRNQGISSMGPPRFQNL